MKFDFITHGFPELEAAFVDVRVKVDPETGAALSAMAVPIKKRASQLAVDNIANIGPEWSKMRSGRRRTSVYVAEKQRRAAGHGPSYARPNLSGLMWEKSLKPATDEYEEETKLAVEAVLLKLSTKIGTVV